MPTTSTLFTIALTAGLTTLAFAAANAAPKNRAPSKTPVALTPKQEMIQRTKAAITPGALCVCHDREATTQQYSAAGGVGVLEMRTGPQGDYGKVSLNCRVAQYRNTGKKVGTVANNTAWCYDFTILE